MISQIDYKIEGWQFYLEITGIFFSYIFAENAIVSKYQKYVEHTSISETEKIKISIK